MSSVPPDYNIFDEDIDIDDNTLSIYGMVRLMDKYERRKHERKYVQLGLAGLWRHGGKIRYMSMHGKQAAYHPPMNEYKQTRDLDSAQFITKALRMKRTLAVFPLAPSSETLTKNCGMTWPITRDGKVSSRNQEVDEYSFGRNDFEGNGSRFEPYPEHRIGRSRDLSLYLAHYVSSVVAPRVPDVEFYPGPAPRILRRTLTTRCGQGPRDSHPTHPSRL